MSRQYYDDPYGSSRRVNIQSRRNLPATPSDFVAHSSFQPNRQSYSIPYSQPIPSQTYYPNNYANAGHYPSYNAYPTSTRPSVNRVNYPTNDQAHRRYVLETPIAHTRVPQQQYPQHQSYNNNNNTNNNDDEDDDNYYSPRYQSSRNLPTISRPHRTDTNHDNYPRYQTNSDQYNRRDRREQPQPNRSYPVQSQRRSINVPVVRQSSTSSRPPMPLQIHHPPSLLAQFLYGIFGPQGIPFDDDDDDDDDANRNHSSVTPVDLIAFAWMGPDTSIIAIPSAIRIQFGDFLDLLAHDEPPAVGLSENEIEHIPITTYRKTSKSKSEEEKCAICLSSYKNGEKVKRLRCKHIFHPDCIDPWLKTSTQCPICRGSQST